jgi:hypothetical protein
MNHAVLIDDMRRATGRILDARVPVRVRACRDGLVVEAPAGVATPLRRPVEARVTWARLNEAPGPVLRPLVEELIAALRNGGPLPAGFTPPTISKSRGARRLH